MGTFDIAESTAGGYDPSLAVVDDVKPLKSEIKSANLSNPMQGTMSTANSFFRGDPSERDPELGSMRTPEDQPLLPRLVLRNRAFHQSANKINIQHNKGIRIVALLKHNWFHVLLRWPTMRSLPLLLMLWTLGILFFAQMYVWYDNIETNVSCGLSTSGDPMDFAGAFGFSLETCTTVGYTLPYGVNGFFEADCSGLQVIIYFQMIFSMLFNAFLLAFLYSRIARPEKRGGQVLCSNKALVNIVDGQIRFQVRLFDADAQHPVVEQHCRLYAVMKHRPVPRPLRLLQPDDELGAMVFLSFPTVITHHIDIYSLLHPPTTSIAPLQPHGLLLRQVDAGTAIRADVPCPVCGEVYGTMERWMNHVRFTQIIEGREGYPQEGTHLSIDVAEIEEQIRRSKDVGIAELKEYFASYVSEVICIVEGIDPLMSGTFQALQSYRFEDIVWEKDAQFAPCITVKGKDNHSVFEVDLDRYHGFEKAPTNPAEQPSPGLPPPKKKGLVKSLSHRPFDSLF